MTAEELIKKHAILQNVECEVSIGDGWTPLVDKLCMQIEKHLQITGLPDFAVTQVKEKFGGLRFYVAKADKTIYEMIHKAEKESTVTCERCGNPGHLRDGGWILTLCDSCVKNK